MNQRKKDAKKNLEEAKREIVAGDKLLKNGVSITSFQAEKLEKWRLEYIQNMIPDENRAEIFMNSYAMNIYQSYLPSVRKKYLPVLSGEGFKQDNRIRYFDITKWVIDAEEKNMDKLVNVSGAGCRESGTFRNIFCIITVYAMAVKCRSLGGNDCGSRSQ